MTVCRLTFFVNCLCFGVRFMNYVSINSQISKLENRKVCYCVKNMRRKDKEYTSTCIIFENVQHWCEGLRVQVTFKKIFHTFWILYKFRSYANNVCWFVENFTPFKGYVSNIATLRHEITNLLNHDGMVLTTDSSCHNLETHFVK